MGSGSGSTIAIAHLAEALFFGGVPDDILLNILSRLDEDPRDLARLACVSTRFCKLIKTVCWKFRCEKILPLLVAELLQSPSPAFPCPEPPGGWASLQKLLICCPGLWHAGVLLENWDFGLDREMGWSGNFGYPDGFSYSDGSGALENIFSEANHSHTCKSLDKKSARLGAFTSTPCASTSFTLGKMFDPFALHLTANDSRDVCELDSINTCTHCSEAGMDSDGNKEGMNCDKNEADMGSNGKEVVMDNCECDKKAFNMVGNENGMDSDGIEVGMHCDNEEEGKYCVKTEVGMDKCRCNKPGNKLGPKHCYREFMNGVADVRDYEFQESGIRPHDDSLGSEVLEVDGVMVAMKQGAVEICKSTCTQSWPTSFNSDPLNLMNLETGCRHAVSTHVNQMHIATTAQEKRMQEHKPKSHKRQRKCHHEHCHVTTGPCNLSREQGNKLLANRFRADSLYICDWPGCLHPGDKRMYKLFRGVFKNFKHSHVWRNLKDMQAKATNVGCAFCVCKSTWDMVTTFCLKRSIEYHDDGEPVVRAYVCENGHVAGAWTDRPMSIL